MYAAQLEIVQAYGFFRANPAADFLLSQATRKEFEDCGVAIGYSRF